MIARSFLSPQHLQQCFLTEQAHTACYISQVPCCHVRVCLRKRKTLWPKCWTEMFRFLLLNVSNGNVRIYISTIIFFKSNLVTHTHTAQVWKSKDSCENWFALFPVWVLGIELGFPGLAQTFLPTELPLWPQTLQSSVFRGYQNLFLSSNWSVLGKT